MELGRTSQFPRPLASRPGALGLGPGAVILLGMIGGLPLALARGPGNATGSVTYEELVEDRVSRMSPGLVLGCLAGVESKRELGDRDGRPRKIFLPSSQPGLARPYLIRGPEDLPWGRNVQNRFDNCKLQRAPGT
ncbi:hypothetical protein BO71DRAFT_431902 [Aspergillus ellipticus CBS 707.79]|uniref:Uncharacterized protein n=1 Tax=Aspergillus ellipticus CBS 707.79 TaxID=1448320 RepID=A0A319D4Y0_9EURO|nr:hypothetical protein BO71DRAFT_431902 [Aspergillus ellipticus CBS 707.79]